MGCEACQGRGTECQCSELEYESEENLSPAEECPGSGCREDPLVEIGLFASRPLDPDTRKIAVLSPDDTPTQSSSLYQSLCQTTDPLARIVGSVEISPTMHNCLGFHGGNSHSFLLQHETQQLLTPPYGCHGQPISNDYRSGTTMTAGRVDCLESLFSLAWPDDQSTRVPWMTRSAQMTKLSLDLDQDLDNDSEDPENVQGAFLDSLSLDRNVESNNIPFILQANAVWVSYFLFEPMRVVHLARDYVFQNYARGEEIRWRLDLLARSSYVVTRSANYDLGKTPFLFIIQAAILRVLTKARSHFEVSQELDRQYALEAMLNTYELISSMCKVGSFSSVLNIMQLAAPVFRRACSDSPQCLVNLPSLLKTSNICLQYYGALDVLLGVLTARPTFFRYNVDFTLEAPESLFLLEDGPGLRWLYGVPDRLLLTFAKMNAIFEDFGSHVNQEIATELEAEIKCLQPIVGSSIEPALSVGRVVVQQCWFLAALIYLHMGLCGATQADTRVAKVRKQFIKILATVRPRRNPDMFLVSPMLILGVATGDPNERNLIRRRMLGVSECSRSGTMGNDLVRILDAIWAMRRPVVWSDLRWACWEISGF